ncbi:MAG TPA: glycosyltransferase family 4 protein [Solirubrobacterales bacterium]|nr:glycosyltransferase family 4 protein [Solirubrobacterales bacterium]
MRVTLLTHYYPPEVGAPQARLSALARGLSRRGVEVTVHTGFPHYPDGVIQPPYRNRPWQTEEADGVRVVRSAVYPAPNRGFGRRILNHVSFGLSSVASSPASGPADAVIVETPPLLLAGASIAYAGTKEAALIVNVSDMWPDSAVALGTLRRPRLVGAARALEHACYRRAAAIVCPTRGIETALGFLEEAGGKVHRIPPSVDPELFPASPPRANGTFKVLYAGTLGMSQGVGTLVDAAELLDDSPEIQFVIAGDGAEGPELRRRLADGRAPNVTMLGRVPHERIPELYAEADAAVVLLRDRPLFEGALPTKMFEAMSAARPLVLSAAGEAATLVKEVSCGVVVPPERPQELAVAVADLSRDRARAGRLGAAGRQAVVEGYSRERAFDRWYELLRDVTR